MSVLGNRQSHQRRHNLPRHLLNWSRCTEVHGQTAQETEPLKEDTGHSREYKAAIRRCIADWGLGTGCREGFINREAGRESDQFLKSSYSTVHGDQSREQFENSLAKRRRGNTDTEERVLGTRLDENVIILYLNLSLQRKKSGSSTFWCSWLWTHFRFIRGFLFVI